MLLIEFKMCEKLLNVFLPAHITKELIFFAPDNVNVSFNLYNLLCSFALILCHTLRSFNHSFV